MISVPMASYLTLKRPPTEQKGCWSSPGFVDNGQCRSFLAPYGSCVEPTTWRGATRPFEGLGTVRRWRQSHACAIRPIERTYRHSERNTITLGIDPLHRLAWFAASCASDSSTSRMPAPSPAAARLDEFRFVNPHSGRAVERTPCAPKVRQASQLRLVEHGRGGDIHASWPRAAPGARRLADRTRTCGDLKLRPKYLMRVTPTSPPRSDFLLSINK